MNSYKSPVPDGLTVFFYQNIWDIVKEDLTSIVNKFMFDGIIVRLKWYKYISVSSQKKTNQMKCLNFGLSVSVMWVIGLFLKYYGHKLKKVLPDTISKIYLAFFC